MYKRNGLMASVLVTSATPQGSSSSDSLEGQSCDYASKSYDAVVFDVLKVTPEEFASQITLMDIPVFKAIQPEELASCGWSKKEKHSLAPNVVAFTRRFNQVSFWVVREILTAQTLKIRAEILSHFVKIAKKLLELNNLHSLMSVVSALQSAPIFRLTKTWAQSESHQMSPYQNSVQLRRRQMEKSPMRNCYPSMYCLWPWGLSTHDLRWRGEPRPHRRAEDEDVEMRAQALYAGPVLRDEPPSHDEDLELHIAHENDIMYPKRGFGIMSYCELLNRKDKTTFEKLDYLMSKEDNYKRTREYIRSLKMVPSIPYLDHLTTLPHVQKYLKSVRYIEELQKFVEDDNYNMMCQLSVVESKSATFPSEKARHLLDDSVLESRSPRRGLALTSSTVTNGLSLGSSESSEFSEEMSSGLESPTSPCTCTLGSSAAVPTMEGPLRRKTLLKEGRKPALSSWTRYWVILSGSTLLYYRAKSLRGTDRKHYKSTPGKKVSIVGWMVQLPDDPEHPDIFQLNNPDKGNVYKFQTGSRFHAILWHKHLDDACKSNRPQVPANLMSFE
ncbi:Ras-specific guanine nucleotide-releasing factor RalGPS1 [Fukomys damarensis]|uniref:Ras-specific guanine nucleotide-releasing factor RalGPS1 n=1 Tax=Fukomys damarensis TaxID=885580 RepID=A0A091CNB2_FUKDA|nr:Ras-specific guanine nucleotide-releasing factor RalGPS1 [Fukomys damarensis]